MTGYQNKHQTNRYFDLDRADHSRTDYNYQAHREAPKCITVTFPIHCVNEIMFDERPRLVNTFAACIGDSINTSKLNDQGKGKGRLVHCIADASLFHEQQHKVVRQPIQTNIRPLESWISQNKKSLRHDCSLLHSTPTFECSWRGNNFFSPSL